MGQYLGTNKDGDKRRRKRNSLAQDPEENTIVN